MENSTEIRSQNKKIGHREGFIWVWSGIKFMFHNWSVFASVGASFFFFWGNAFHWIILPLGQKTVVPFIREPVKAQIKAYGAPIVNHIDSVHNAKLDFLQKQIDTLKNK